jgi:Uma2 family endonuclease
LAKGGRQVATPQSQLHKKLHTVAEYLEFERQAEERHYFIDGEIFAMAGESPQHSSVNVDLIVEIASQLRGTSCRVFSPNMKIRSGERFSPNSMKGLFSYADMTVCDVPQFHDEIGDVLVNPKVIFEILSPSTESFDRGEKFRRFRTYNDSLTDYVLISQTHPIVEHFQRQPNGQWLMTEVIGLENELHIGSINCRLKLAEVYDRVTFQHQTHIEANDEETIELE